jgi:hypothetical protein
MKREIVIFTVLITNITFAATLPSEIREVSEVTTSKKKVNSLCGMAVMNLHERGLDENAAKQKVLKFLQHDKYVNDLMAQNIVKNLDGIKPQDIVQYVSDSVLFEKSVDLSSYENLVALAQKSRKLALDKGTLEKIKKISFENKNLKSLYNA